jgi:hypothetical protein
MPRSAAYTIVVSMVRSHTGNDFLIDSDNTGLAACGIADGETKPLDTSL